jgi:hypothetical protein
MQPQRRRDAEEDAEKNFYCLCISLRPSLHLCVSAAPSPDYIGVAFGVAN